MSETQKRVARAPRPTRPRQRQKPTQCAQLQSRANRRTGQAHATRRPSRQRRAHPPASISTAAMDATIERAQGESNGGIKAFDENGDTFTLSAWITQLWLGWPDNPGGDKGARV